ncbi:MAG: NAD(P)H-quinone oxidoreductase [Rubrivivax sp.]
MKAIVLEAFGGPEMLRLRELPPPVAGAGEVVVRVAATALNHADLLQRSGTYTKGAEVGMVIGMECSGTIESVGSGVAGWQVGDRVCALVSRGAYAELVAAPATQVMPIPAGIDALAAAALPEVAATVWSNIVDIGRLAAGESLLVHGGAGGVGSIAIQVAAAMGANVCATAGGAAKLARCRELGAARAIDYRSEDFVAAVRDETGGRGADLILDNMGAAYLDRNIDALAPDGRIVMIGLQGGREATLSLARLMGKRATLHATSLRDRPAAAKARIIEGVVRDLWPLVAAGRVRPVVDRVFALDDMAAAHRYLEQGAHVGKVLVTCPPSR